MAEPSAAEALAASIERRETKVGVVGLGYVGLPLSLTFAEAGVRVIGFDVDAAKVEALQAGRCYIGHLDGRRVANAITARSFEATSDLAGTMNTSSNVRSGSGTRSWRKRTRRAG